MKKRYFGYNVMALVWLALLFLSIKPAFAQSQAADYLCELGKSFYSLGRVDDALTEFTKVLLIEPGNKVAQDYINRIFKVNLPENPSLAQDLVVREPKQEPLVESIQKSSKAPLTIQPPKPRLSRDEAMDLTLNQLQPKEGINYSSQEGEGLKVGPLRIGGKMQLSFGVTPHDFIWKRANFDLNEKFFSWRMTSDAVFNHRFNTYDPAIYDSLSVNLDTENKQGFNFHSNLTVDPWSFTGKSDKVTVTGGTDRAEVQMYYWSNTGYIVNHTLYTSLEGKTINLPELKVVDGKTAAVTLGSFNIPEMKIDRQFQPVRELWFDYSNDQIKFRAFPIGYQDQAYTSDDPLNITNHGIWWKDSKWLRMYTPGIFNSGTVPASFTKGRWDDSLSFLSKDSTGKYLNALRGFSFNFQPDALTSFDTTFATPKHLWQDYGELDNVISANRLKHYFADNFMAGLIFTSRSGFKVDNNELDSQNYVEGIDLGYEITNGLKAQAEVLSSQSSYDMSNSVYKTESQGAAYYFSLVSRYPQKSIMDSKYGYDGIALDKDEDFLLKSKFYISRMDRGFDSALSDYHNTRQDTSWSRHIHFRKPMDYYSQGLEGSITNWGELNATRIGDGIDIGRSTLGFRFETLLGDRFYNLFDLRNVHSVEGKFVENAARDEVTVKLTDKLTAKGLGIYQKLPRTIAGIDPFIFDGKTGDFFQNSTVTDGLDPTIQTGSIGLNYAFFDWLSLNGIYECTNDYTLAYGNFPRNVLRDDSALDANFTQNDQLYLKIWPFLYEQGVFPQAPYEFYNVFKCGLRIMPLENMEIYLDYTRNEFEAASLNSDNMNHVGIELTYMPVAKFGLSFKYSYSRCQDVDPSQNGLTGLAGHHNFFSEFRYLPSKDSELIFQYGVGDTNSIANQASFDPYGGNLITLDTQQIIRAFYRQRF
jgi:hypothetical protein